MSADEVLASVLPLSQPVELEVVLAEVVVVVEDDAVEFVRVVYVTFFLEH